MLPLPLVNMAKWASPFDCRRKLKPSSIAAESNVTRHVRIENLVGDERRKKNITETPDSLTLCIKRVTQAQNFLGHSKFSSSYATHRYARWTNVVAQKLFFARNSFYNLIMIRIWTWRTICRRFLLARQTTPNHIATECEKSSSWCSPLMMSVELGAQPGVR